METNLLDAVGARLDSLGISMRGSDSWVLDFAIQKVKHHINNACNTPSLPDGLYEVAVDMACGEFLFAKKQGGTLSDLDFEAVVKQVSAGDTTVSFDTTQSPEKRFDDLISFLLTRGTGDFACYRKLKW